MRILADEKQISVITDRLVEEAGAMMARETGPWAVVGVRSRGDDLAGRLAKRLKPDYQGTLDIALYRDDLSEVGAQPTVRETEIDFPVDGTNILLVDDVLMTGRSIRAAIQSLIDFGRPRCIRLIVLVDRGRRQLPIAPDLVGMRVNTDPGQRVEVNLKPTDESDRIYLIDAPSEQT